MILIEFNALRRSERQRCAPSKHRQLRFGHLIDPDVFVAVDKRRCQTIWALRAKKKVLNAAGRHRQAQNLRSRILGAWSPSAESSDHSAGCGHGVNSPLNYVPLAYSFLTQLMNLRCKQQKKNKIHPWWSWAALKQVLLRDWASQAASCLPSFIPRCWASFLLCAMMDLKFFGCIHLINGAWTQSSFYVVVTVNGTGKICKVN